MSVLAGTSCLLLAMLGITVGAIGFASAREARKDIFALLRRIEDLEERRSVK